MDYVQQIIVMIDCDVIKQKSDIAHAANLTSTVKIEK